MSKLDKTYFITDIMRTGVFIQPPQMWPTHDGENLERTDYVSASESAYCVRRLAFKKEKDRGRVQNDNYFHDLTDEEWGMYIANLDERNPIGYFERGHNVEAWLVERLMAGCAGTNEGFLFVGKGQVSLHTEDHVSGTPDGLYYNKTTGETRVLEIKSSKSDNIYAPYNEHLSQVNVNCALFIKLWPSLQSRFPELKGLKHPRGGDIIYVNSHHYLTTSEFAIEYDGGAAYSEAALKAIKLGLVKREFAEPKGVQAEGLIKKSAGVSPCYLCDDKVGCKAIEDAAGSTAMGEQLKKIINSQDPPEMPKFAIDTPITAALLFEYKINADQEKTYKEEKAGLREIILPAVKEAGGKIEFTMSEDERTITAKVSTSTRAGSLDKKRLEVRLQELGESLSDYVGEGTEVTQLRVTIK